MKPPLKHFVSVRKRTDYAGAGSGRKPGDNKPADDLLNLEGLDRARHSNWLPVVFVRWKISPSRALMTADIEGMTDEKAGELIMAARNICWFGDEA